MSPLSLCPRRCSVRLLFPDSKNRLWQFIWIVQKTPDKLTRGTGGGGTTNVSEHINNSSLLFTSENGLLHIISDKAQLVQLYNLNGQKVKDIELMNGNNTVSGIAKGIYVIKNQKVVIK